MVGKTAEMSEKKLSLLQTYRNLGELPRPIWTLAAANLVNRCGAMVLAFLTLYYVKVLGYSLPVAGLLTAVYSAGSVLSAPLAAQACRHFSAWRVLTAAMVGSGVMMFLYPQITELTLLVPATLLFGTITEVARPAGYTCIGQLTKPEEKRRAFALHRLAVNVGMSLGPALGGFLATYSYNYIFWVDGATSLLAACVLIFQTASVEKQMPKKNEAAPGKGLPARFRLFLIGNFVGLLVFTQMFAAVPLFAVELAGFSEAQAGLLFSINTVLVMLLEAPVVGYTEHWKLSRVLALGNLLQGLGLGLFAIIPTYAGMVGGVFLFTLGEMLQAPNGLAYVNQSVDESLLPKANAWLSGTGSVAFLIATPLTAYSLHELGGTIHWGVVAGLGIFACVWMMMLGEPDLTES